MRGDVETQPDRLETEHYEIVKALAAADPKWRPEERFYPRFAAAFMQTEWYATAHRAALVRAEHEQRQAEASLESATAWAAGITRHECHSAVHDGWWDRDDERFAVCPWCMVEATEAVLDRVRQLRDEWGEHDPDEANQDLWAALDRIVGAAVGVATPPPISVHEADLQVQPGWPEAMARATRQDENDKADIRHEPGADAAIEGTRT